MTPCTTIDPDLWTSENLEDRHQAAKLCTPCPLTTACAQGALNRGEHAGVYGGIDFDRNSGRLTCAETRCHNIGAHFGTDIQNHTVIVCDKHQHTTVRPRGIGPKPEPTPPTPRATNTHCAHGHPWTNATTTHSNGYRRCTICRSHQERTKRATP